MTIYALHGPATGDLLTFQGRPIIHDDRAELEYLLPEEARRGCRIVPVTARDLAARSPLPPIPIPQHPAYQGLSFPLRREQFR